MERPIFRFCVGCPEVYGDGFVGVSESRAWIGGEGDCGVFVQGGQRIGKDLYVFHNLGSGLRYVLHGDFPKSRFRTLLHRLVSLPQQHSRRRCQRKLWSDRERETEHPLCRSELDFGTHSAKAVRRSFGKSKKRHTHKMLDLTRKTGCSTSHGVKFTRISSSLVPGTDRSSCGTSR